MVLDLAKNDNVFKWSSCHTNTSRENVGGQKSKQVPNFCLNGDKCPFYLLVDCLIHFHVPQVAKLLSWWLIKDDKPIFQHSKMSNKNKR